MANDEGGSPEVQGVLLEDPMGLGTGGPNKVAQAVQQRPYLFGAGSSV